MTVIDFYHSAADRLAVVVRLVAKEAPARTPVRILTPDAGTTESVDRILWQAPPTSFLPHCRMDSPLAAATPVWIDHRLEHAGPASILVNLCADPPPFFSRFERLIEVVTGEEADVLAGRQRFRYYRERGYELRAHDARKYD